MVPEKSANVPLTLLIRWRTLKPTSECEGSMDQVPVTSSVVSICWVMRSLLGG